MCTMYIVQCSFVEQKFVFKSPGTRESTQIQIQSNELIPYAYLINEKAKQESQIIFSASLLWLTSHEYGNDVNNGSDVFWHRCSFINCGWKVICISLEQSSSINDSVDFYASKFWECFESKDVHIYGARSNPFWSDRSDLHVILSTTASHLIFSIQFSLCLNDMHFARSSKFENVDSQQMSKFKISMWIFVHILMWTRKPDLLYAVCFRLVCRQFQINKMEN